MPDARSTYEKTQILDRIVDYCSTPRRAWEIIDDFKHLRSHKSLFAYIQELHEEGLLFKIPTGKGKQEAYLNFQPSQQQLITGQYLTDDGESPLKLFRTDPAVTAEGLTTYPALDVVFKWSPVVGELWKTIHSYMIVQCYSRFLEEHRLGVKSQIDMAFWTLKVWVDTLSSVLEQIGKDSAIFESLEGFEERIGFSQTTPKEVADAWRLIVQKQLVSGDPEAVSRTLPKKQNEDEAS